MTDLRSCLPEELARQLSEWGEPAYRAKQLFAWLQKGAEAEEMTNLPQALRNNLTQELPQSPRILRHLRSQRDGTQKLLLALDDGNTVESVLMSYAHGVTQCLSTQVGCAMGCRFCVSTLGGVIRNLTPGEMISQINQANALLRPEGKRVHNVVLMGMGEPLDNYDNTVRFLRLLHHPEGLNIGLRGVSLSTCGLVPQMRAFAQEGLPVTLSVSLHAADDETRKSIMPVARAYTIAQILEACRYYLSKTGRRIIFEYALIEGVNSGEEDARKLAALLRGMQCHVNLIKLNPVPECGLRSATPKQAQRFLEILQQQHISATQRREMGRDIEGACGQLRRRHQQSTDGGQS